MKTIKEWLSELPEPYKTKALANASKAVLKEEEPDLNQALRAAFIWETAPEGKVYWDNVTDALGYLITNALSAIHAIALKKGFPAEEIMGIQYNAVDENWHYQLKEDESWTTINLSNDK